MTAPRILQLLLVILISACSNKSPKTSQEGTVQTDSVMPAEHEEEHESEGDKKVSLNNGKKWEANPETTEGIHKMNELVNSQPAAPSLENFHSLKGNLETEFNAIIEKCTMTGDAHEQLHNYLIPLRQEIGNLSSEDLSVCKSSFDTIKRHLAEYENYFM
jgi:hypothetical protein